MFSSDIESVYNEKKGGDARPPESKYLTLIYRAEKVACQAASYCYLPIGQLPGDVLSPTIDGCPNAETGIERENKASSA